MKWRVRKRCLLLALALSIGSAAHGRERSRRERHECRSICDQGLECAEPRLRSRALRHGRAKYDARCRAQCLKDINKARQQLQQQCERQNRRTGVDPAKCTTVCGQFRLCVEREHAARKKVIPLKLQELIAGCLPRCRTSPRKFPIVAGLICSMLKNQSLRKK